MTVSIGSQKPPSEGKRSLSSHPLTQGIAQNGLWKQKRIFLLSFGFLTLTVICLLALGLWSWYGQLEESIPGLGQMVPEGKLRRVMSPVVGVVSKVYVKENQEVKAGQILVELDPNPALSEERGFKERLALLEQEANALQAASQGGGVMGGLGPVQSAWLSSTQEAYQAQKTEADMAIVEAQNRLDETQQRLKQAKDVLSISQQLVTRYRKLYADGGISQKELQEFEQRYNSQQGDVASLTASVEAAKSSLDKSLQRPAQVTGNYQSQILARLAEHQQNIATLRSDAERAQFNSQHQVIRAPMDGIVNEQIVRGPGEVVQPGQALMTLVPSGYKVVAEVRINNRDLAYIHMGQQAALRLDAFPYQRFGKLFGTITAISPSTQQIQAPPPSSNANERSDVLPGQSSPTPYYILTITPEKQVMTADGKSFPIRAGMTVAADMITREKSILSFFTEPLHFHLDRAFRDPTNR